MEDYFWKIVSLGRNIKSVDIFYKYTLFILQLNECFLIFTLI